MTLSPATCRTAAGRIHRKPGPSKLPLAPKYGGATLPERNVRLTPVIAGEAALTADKGVPPSDNHNSLQVLRDFTMGFTRRQLLTGQKPNPALFGPASGAQPWRVRDGAACLPRRGIECRLCGESCSIAAIHFPTRAGRTEEHKSELQSLMRNTYAVFCLKQK